MDRVASRLPAPTWPTMVRSVRLAHLLSLVVFPLVVFLRCLCAAHLRPGRLYRSIRGLYHHRGCDRHVGLAGAGSHQRGDVRSEAHTSELQSLMRISYAVFCFKNKTNTHHKIRWRRSKHVKD